MELSILGFMELSILGHFEEIIDTSTKLFQNFLGKMPDKSVKHFQVCHTSKMY